MNNAQSGNVLFYILIAVALLAALSYTLAQSGRGGIGKVNEEKAALYATEIIEYGNILSQAVSQIRLRGYKDTQISFENTKVTGYTNANCLEDECEIFHINGGGINWTSPPPNANDGSQWLFTVNNIANIGTSSVDAIMILQNLDLTVCQMLNKKLYGTTAIPQEEDTITLAKFTGTYSGATISDSGNVMAGKNAYCFEGGGTPAAGTYHYYQVLMAR